MEALTPTHLALILLGFMVLFGYKKLPDAARSVGRSLRIFRSEMHAMTEEPAATGQQPDAAALEAQARSEEARAAILRAQARAAQEAAS